MVKPSAQILASEEKATSKLINAGIVAAAIIPAKRK